jgi:hypothetical protein
MLSLKNKLDYIVFIICFSFITISVAKIYYSKQYYLSNEDEITYFSSAKLFSETNSLKASCCINESRSKIGEFNWYGPSYHIIFGSITYIFGNSPSVFIIFNYFLFLLSIFFISKFNLEKKLKKMFIVLYLCSYASFSYVFTFFPETLHLTMIITLLLVYSYTPKRNNILLFIGLVLLFSLIKYTFILFIFLTIPDILSKKKNKIIYMSISILSFFLIFIYFKFFTAPAFAKGLKLIHGESDSNGIITTLINVLKNGYTNLYTFFNKSTISLSIISVFLLIITTSLVVITKKIYRTNLKLFSIYFLAISYFLIYLFFYTSDTFFFEKQAIVIIPILIFFLVNSAEDLSIYYSIFIFLFLPFSLMKTKNNINDRRNSFHQLALNKNKIDQLQTIFNGISINPNKKEINVLIDYSAFQIFNNLTLSFLPVSINKTPILYTTNINCSNKYELHNKIKVDYIISKEIINNDDYTLLKNNATYNIYSIKIKK